MAKNENQGTGDAGADQAAENAKLKAALEAAEKRADDLAAELKAKPKGGGGGLSADDAELVKLKMAAGLTQAQAVEVIRSQKAHDAELAKAAGKK